MSTREQWPGESPDLSDDEGEVENPELEAAEADDDENGVGDEGDESDDHDDGDGADESDDDVGEDTDDALPELRLAGHVDGELGIPDDVDVLEGEARSTRRAVGLVVSRADVEVANRLLESALAELDRAGVGREHVLVMAVPGPFELPLGAMALAKTRRYSCIVALGSATDSPVVAAEAASGLQLAALETGVPVAFGLLTEAGADSAERGADAVRNALEMADLFHHLRAAAKGA